MEVCFLAAVKLRGPTVVGAWIENPQLSFGQFDRNRSKAVAVVGQVVSIVVFFWVSCQFLR